MEIKEKPKTICHPGWYHMGRCWLCKPHVKKFVFIRVDQLLIDKYGLYGYDMRLRLQAFGPFGNRQFVNRMTFEKKLKENKK